MAEIKAMPNKDSSELDAAIAQAERMLDTVARTSDVIARARKTAYDAHIKAGFSSKEALELCKNI